MSAAPNAAAPPPNARAPIVLAFGGNALLPDPFHPEDQEARARDLARCVLALDRRGSGVVLVHGNGPQVGMILLRVDATRDRLPPEPLDVLVAETQGSVGLLLARALHNALSDAGRDPEVTTVLTQVVVDEDDPAFGVPTKPVGPHYDAAEADKARAERGWHLVEEHGRGWRRLVPSPVPLEVVELRSIGSAARAGALVIAGGGGGVAVARTNGRLVGLEAVVDKDRTASLLARSLGASTFVVLTGVPHVSRRFGTPAEEALPRLSIAKARALLDAGEFPAGSMGPKVAAACDYVEATGNAALITDTKSLVAALEERAGTWIHPTTDPAKDVR